MDISTIERKALEYLEILKSLSENDLRNLDPEGFDFVANTYIVVNTYVYSVTQPYMVEGVNIFYQVSMVMLDKLLEVDLNSVSLNNLLLKNSVSWIALGNHWMEVSIPSLQAIASEYRRIVGPLFREIWTKMYKELLTQQHRVLHSN